MVMIATFLKNKLPNKYTLLSLCTVDQSALLGDRRGDCRGHRRMLAFPVPYFTNLNVLLGFCLLPFSVWIVGKQRVNY